MKLHPRNYDRCIRLIAEVLEGYGIYSPKSQDRARNILQAGVGGEPMIPQLIASMLVTTKVVMGIDDDFKRAAAALDISRIWIYMTSESADQAVMRLHLTSRMTKKAAAKWMLEKGLISQLIHDSIIRSAYGGGVETSGVITDDQTGMQIDFGKTFQKNPRRGLIRALSKLEAQRRILKGN